MTDQKIFDLMEGGARLEAYELLVETYHTSLTRSAEYWIARYKLPVTPDETVEDVLVRFIMDELHRGVKKLLPFLKSMVRSDLHQLGRKQWRQVELPPDIKGYSALEEEVVQKDDVEYLMQLIMTPNFLSWKQSLVMFLHYRHNVPIEKIAYHLTLKPTSIPVMMSVARKKIRDAYAHGVPDIYEYFPFDVDLRIIDTTIDFIFDLGLNKKAGSP
jgi:DNA-directed RNA polymerase specialized sigma24 family protein